METPVETARSCRAICLTLAVRRRNRHYWRSGGQGLFSKYHGASAYHYEKWASAAATPLLGSKSKAASILNWLFSPCDIREFLLDIAVDRHNGNVGDEFGDGFSHVPEDKILSDIVQAFIFGAVEC